MRKIEDLTGQKFERLLVIEEAGRKGREVLWKCLCDCGNYCFYVGHRLRKRRVISCGCAKKSPRKRIKVEEIIGKTFHELTVIKKAGKDKQGTLLLCQCSCGNTTLLHTRDIVSGNTRSCGCLGTKHKQYGTRLYQTWADMKRRCYNEDSKSYKYYGAKGVEVCAEWKEDFQSFYDWAMSHNYNDNLTIDRINPFGNYEPSNCKWSTRLEQAKNTRKKFLKDNQKET